MLNCVQDAELRSAIALLVEISWVLSIVHMPNEVRLRIHRRKGNFVSILNSLVPYGKRKVCYR